VLFRLNLRITSRPFLFCNFINQIAIMISIVGIFENGYVKLDKEFSSDKPVKVIVTFLEDVDTSSTKGLSLSDFSFAKSRQALSGYKGSFSDAVSEERRNDV
jgi:hypothetical protein